MENLRRKVYASPVCVCISLDSHSLRVCCSSTDSFSFTDPVVEVDDDVDDDFGDNLSPHRIADTSLLSKSAIFPSRPF